MTEAKHPIPTLDAFIKELQETVRVKQRTGILTDTESTVQMASVELKAMCDYLIKLQLDPDFQKAEREIYQRKKAQAISK
jgi:hypothetical protein